ncbi:hypothetical protein G6F31_020800 [Rhizopus arrhizus]|nr:hypothetical protein G6F31_020800 [Rhizopus arrhizus]
MMPRLHQDVSCITASLAASSSVSERLRSVMSCITISRRRWPPIITGSADTRQSSLPPSCVLNVASRPKSVRAWPTLASGSAPVTAANASLMSSTCRVSPSHTAIGTGASRNALEKRSSLSRSATSVR